jgi:hypothetical protein
MVSSETIFSVLKFSAIEVNHKAPSHSREGGNPVSQIRGAFVKTIVRLYFFYWIAAYAGMTQLISLVTTLSGSTSGNQKGAITRAFG